MPITPITEPEPDRQFGRSPPPQHPPPCTAWTMRARNDDVKTAAESFQPLSHYEYTYEKLRSLADTDEAVCSFDVNYFEVNNIQIQ
jgi:hypothetical protein